jgi:DNA helicase-2/ATP-dependent DNA helicase PcrA
VPGLRSAAVNSLIAFAGLIQRYTALAAHIKVGELLEKLIEETGLIDALREEGPEGDDRIENVKELVAGASASAEDTEPAGEDAEQQGDFTALDLYLQRVSLIADVDRHDPEANAVTLMTLHNAKGLEFPFVFIAGLEDGLFPLARAYDEPDMLEEERRLFYVGITRGEEKVYLTYARTRRRAGEVLACIPSSFLAPVPQQLLEVKTTPALARVRYSGETGWRDRTGPRGGDGFARRRDDEDSGTWIDYTDSQDAPRFVKGERVRHPQFGRGIIRELSGFGRDLKAVIDFESVGRKKVVLRYANLQKEL